VSEMAASYQVASRPDDDRGITLQQFLVVFWGSRWQVLCVMLILAVSAALAAWLVPKEYETTILLSPVTSHNNPTGGSGGLGSTISQFSGIASLAGLNLGQSGSAKAEAIATLQSEVLTERYIGENELLPILFNRKWDVRLKKWKSHDPDTIPTLWKGNRYFEKEVRKVTENTKTGLVSMAITWKDPIVAARWANGLVKLANDYLRNKAIAGSDRNIAYLNEAASKTTVVELRNAIYTLMESEIKQQMLARGNDEYALEVIDPAVAPEKQAYPEPILWTAGGAVLGLMLGLMVAALRYSLGYTDATGKARVMRNAGT
jgi:capsular polysaccharide biosynthesis protein